MRILFLSAQIPGHLDWGGYLQTAAELSRRGHEALWASGIEVQRLVENAGVRFHALSSTGWRWPPPPPLSANAAPDADSLRRLKQQRALDQWLDVERVALATQEITDLALEFQPDLIVSEMFLAVSGLVAEKLDVPLVITGWPAPAPPPTEASSRADTMAALARDRLQDLLSRFHLNGRYWTTEGPPALLSPDLHLTYWSPSWYDGVPTRPQTQYVGGRMPESAPEPPADLPDPEQAPWALITLGTSFNRDPNFFINAAHAAKRMGCLPLVVFGSDLAASWIQDTLQRLPQSTAVRDRIDFAAVLPYTAVSIHHGGAGTTHALVVHGVPQIVIPHAADQSFQARGVTRTGVGLHIAPRNATIDALVAGLSALLPDRSNFRTQAKALQSEFHALGGIPAAADQIEQVNTQSEHLDHRNTAPQTRKDSPCKP